MRKHSKTVKAKAIRNPYVVAMVAKSGGGRHKDNRKESNRLACRKYQVD